jgi:hypothetical protein
MNLLAGRMESIHLPLLPHEQQYEQGDGEAHGQSNDVDGREAPVLPESASGRLEVTPDHGGIEASTIKRVICLTVTAL